jgi:uncharacterized protein YjiS (DUF1127 family)
MLMKLKFSATEQHAPVNQVWSGIAAYFRSRKQRSRDRRILSQMNDHNLRDIGLSHSQGGSHYYIETRYAAPPP